MIIDYRNSKSSKTQIYRSHMLISRFNRRLSLYVIGRIDYDHSRNRTHQGNIFITLMGCAVLSYGDSGMGRADFNVQFRIAYRITHLLECASCREHSERTRKRHLACSSNARCHSDHITLSNTAVNMTLRKSLLKSTCLRGRCQIGVQYHDILMGFS